MPHVKLFFSGGSASFLVPNLRLLLAVLGVIIMAKVTIHVQPFFLDIKIPLVCGLPFIGLS